MKRNHKGDLYEPNFTTSEIASFLRGFVRRMKNYGYIPRDMRIVINNEKMGEEERINVNIKRLPKGSSLFDPKSCNFREESQGFLREDFRCSKISTEVKKAFDLIRRESDRYNYDNSDIMRDYYDRNFYYDAYVDSELRNAQLDEMYEFFKTGTYIPKFRPKPTVPMERLTNKAIADGLKTVIREIGSKPKPRKVKGGKTVQPKGKCICFGGWSKCKTYAPLWSSASYQILFREGLPVEDGSDLIELDIYNKLRKKQLPGLQLKGSRMLCDLEQ